MPPFSQYAFLSWDFMKILLLGANGQVGWELQRSLAPLGALKVCGRTEADLEDLISLKKLIRQYAPEIIVNAAAYTAVDRAEEEQAKADLINHQAVALLANEAKQLNAWLIHYSTDYVFDGTKTDSYLETDQANPQSVYGTTKLQGEEAVRKSGCLHLIFRTSWVFAARGANFAKTILRLAKQRKELSIVADQHGTPTSAELIADSTALALHHLQHCDNPFSLSGTYHLTASGKTSWFGFAHYLIGQATQQGFDLKTTVDKVQPIPTDEYPLPAKRPSNSQLNSHKLTKTFGIHPPFWQTHAQRLITELLAQEKS